MSGWRTRSCGIIAGIGPALLVAACGGGTSQNATEPHRKFPVTVASATFPVSQKISEHTHLVIDVRNPGNKTIPDVAVTICNVTCAYPASKGEGTSAQAFAARVSEPYLANSSRPTWIVDQGPGKCSFSCHNGGAGGSVTAYANTWALGSLRPGRTLRFEWSVTAVSPGRHVLAWEVAAGLNGRARAVASDGSRLRGTFDVHVDAAPQQSYADNNGHIVNQ